MTVTVSVHSSLTAGDRVSINHLAGRYRHCAPPPISPLIRHCDELRYDTDSLTQAAVGRAHG